MDFRNTLSLNGVAIAPGYPAIAGLSAGQVPRASGAASVAWGFLACSDLSGTINDTQHGARAGGTLHADVIAAGASGFMSGADKTKLDGVATGATANVGTVTSVAMTVPSALLTISGTPITVSGTLALSLATQTINRVLAGPTSGGAVTPTFRLLVAGDIPSLDWSKITTGFPTTLAGFGITDGVSSTATRTANFVFAGPTSGAAAAATFRALVAADIPGLAWSKLTSGVPTTVAGYGITDVYTKTASDAKYALLSHTHVAADIISGVIGVNRLGTGFADATTNLRGDGAWAAVTPDYYNILNLPTTLSGYGITDAVSSTNTQSANLVFAGPGTGAAAAPTFRALVAADLPNHSAALITSGALAVAQGGTALSSYAIGDLLYASGTTALSKLADVAAGSYLRSGGVTTAPVWSTITLPNAATTGDLWYASASNVISALGGAATGNALISGGATTAPSWGKIALTTHISGVLPLANGGTNADLSAAGGTGFVLKQSSVGAAITSAALLAADLPNTAVTAASYGAAASVATFTVDAQGRLTAAATVAIALAASAITSGQLLLARGGTGADLSATGGANQIVRQNSAGGVFTVSTLAAGDIPNLDWSKITSGVPTTLAGYGITDAYTKTAGDARYPLLASANVLTAANTFKLTDTGTNTTVLPLIITHDSSGVIAASFGVAAKFQLQSSTTADQDAGQIGSLWTDPTHATRTSALTFSTVNSAAALAEQVRISGAGNVGINTTAPSARLHIVDANSLLMRLEEYGGDGVNIRAYAALGSIASPTQVLTDSALLRLSCFGYTNGSAFNTTGAKAQLGMFAAETWTTTAQGTYISFLTTPLLTTGIAERMRIDPAGNIGIGLTAPTKKLHITSSTVGDGLYFGASAPALEIGDNATFASATMHGLLALATSAGHYGLAAGDVLLAAYGNSRGNLYINSNYSGTGTTHVGIQTGTGNVGIGTTTPATKFHTKGTVGSMGYFDADAVAGTEVQIFPSGGCTYFFLISAIFGRFSAGTNQSAGLTLLAVPGSGSTSTTMLTDGATTLTVKVYSTGQVTILRGSGTSTIKVGLIYGAL